MVFIEPSKILTNKAQKELLCRLGDVGFNLNYFLIALLQSSLLILAEKFIHRELV